MTPQQNQAENTHTEPIEIEIAPDDQHPKDLLHDDLNLDYEFDDAQPTSDELELNLAIEKAISAAKSTNHTGTPEATAEFPKPYRIPKRKRTVISPILFPPDSTLATSSQQPHGKNTITSTHTATPSIFDRLGDAAINLFEPLTVSIHRDFTPQKPSQTALRRWRRSRAKQEDREQFCKDTDDKEPLKLLSGSRKPGNLYTKDFLREFYRKQDTYKKQRLASATTSRGFILPPHSEAISQQQPFAPPTKRSNIPSSLGSQAWAQATPSIYKEGKLQQANIKTAKRTPTKAQLKEGKTNTERTPTKPRKPITGNRLTPAEYAARSKSNQL